VRSLADLTVSRAIASRDTIADAVGLDGNTCGRIDPAISGNGRLGAFSRPLSLDMARLRSPEPIILDVAMICSDCELSYET
jgi:hypothetical protein